MVLLRDVGQGETRFTPFRDSVNLERLAYYRVKNYFGHT
jgi:hypothetical protein